MIPQNFRLVTAASLVLFALYLGTHVQMLGHVWRSAFPPVDYAIAEEVVVAMGEGAAGGAMTPEAFDRVAADTANLYYPRTDYVQTDPLPLDVFSREDRVLLLEGGQSLRRPWERPVVCLAHTRLHRGRSASRLETRLLVDEPGLKILHAGGRRLVLVFYESPRAFEKAWTYLSWCWFHRQHDDLRYTFEPIPIDRMFVDDRGGGLARFLGGKTLTLYVHESLDGCSPETCYGAARVGPHLGVASDSALAARLPKLRLASSGDGVLILAGGAGEQVGRFTHYLYGTDKSMFLLGTFDGSERARAYLVVRSAQGGSLACDGDRRRNRR